MTRPNGRKVNSVDTDDETNSLNGRAAVDFRSTDTNSDTSVTSEVARLLKGVTDALLKQLTFLWSDGRSKRKFH